MQPPTHLTTPPARGDEDELYRRHHHDLERAVARSVRAPQALIEDACQMAWMTLLRTQPERHSTFAWLRRVAINEAYRLSDLDRRDARLDHLAANKRHGLTHCHELDEHLRAREALGALATLPNRQRRDLALHAAGYSYDEIAAMTRDRTYTNVAKSLRKARARVRLQQLHRSRGTSERDDREGANDAAHSS